MDVNELHINSYLRYHKIKRTGEQTLISYQETLRQIAEHHPGADIVELTREQVEDYLAAAIQRGNAPSTIHRKYRNLRAFYNWCIAEELLDVSPMLRIPEPAVPARPVPIVPDEQIKALLKACSGKDFGSRRDQAIIRLWCEAGSPRAAEMADITLDGLDMRHDLVTLHGKGDRVRTIPFGARTGQALDRYLRVRAKHPDARLPALWLSVNRGALTSWGVRQMLERRCDQAGIPRIHPHRLRHSAAHQFKLAGGSDGDAMVLFGWESEAMPRHYGKSAEVDRAQRSARRISQADRL